MSRMPLLFIGHGSPMNAIEDNLYSRKWIELGKQLVRPSAVLCISAHWFTQGTRVNDSANPRQIYDMYGFPEELYKVRYPAPGSPFFAHRVLEQLGESVSTDNSWGLDHGTWSVLRRVFPDADIPVFQLSVDASATFNTHLAFGKSLSRLREEGVLIVGSGNVVHNLSRIDWRNPGGFNWAQEFDRSIKDAVLNRRLDDLLHIHQAGDSARLAVPTPDHFAPLLYIVGASDTSDRISVFNESCMYGSLSMTSYLFSDGS